MIWITNRRIEVENGVKCTARTDPLIYSLTPCLALLAVVVGTLERGQSCTKHPDSVLVSPVNNLLQANNKVLRADHLVSKWQVLQRSSIRQTRLQMRESKVVDSFQHDQVRNARLSQHIPVKP